MHVRMISNFRNWRSTSGQRMSSNIATELVDLEILGEDRVAVLGL